MATPIESALTNNEPLDNTGQVVSGADVDVNPVKLAQILDGTSGTELNTAASPLMQINNPIIANTQAAAGGVRTAARIRHNPASGTVTDSDGVELLFEGDDDAGNVTVFGEIEVVFTDVSNTTEDANMVFKTMVAGTSTTALTLSSATAAFAGGVSYVGTLVVGVDGTGHDVTFYGDSAGAFALYDADTNTQIIQGATAAGAGTLKLSTGELTNVDGGILGRVDFQAPLDSAGSDAISVGASIWAEADATFSGSVNDTDLVFAVAQSETAQERMRLAWDGTTTNLHFAQVANISSTADITLTPVGDVNLPANIGLTFGNDGEKIEGDGTDLTISGNNINLTAVADVVIPANVGLTFGTGEKIEGDNTDLTVTSGGLITLTATGNTVVTNNAIVSGTLGAGASTLGATTATTMDGVIGSVTPAAGTFTTLTANTSITGTLATAAQGNITSLGTIGSLVATSADINAGTVDAVVGGTTPAAGTFTTLTANTSITGTLATAAQANITSVGTLTSLAVTGTLGAGATTVTHIVIAPYEWCKWHYHW
jgi:hypothetical protein